MTSIEQEIIEEAWKDLNRGRMVGSDPTLDHFLEDQPWIFKYIQVIILREKFDRDEKEHFIAAIWMIYRAYVRKFKDLRLVRRKKVVKLHREKLPFFKYLDKETPHTAQKVIEDYLESFSQRALVEACLEKINVLESLATHGQYLPIQLDHVVMFYSIIVIKCFEEAIPLELKSA